MFDILYMYIYIYLHICIYIYIHIYIYTYIPIVDDTQIAVYGMKTKLEACWAQAFAGATGHNLG